VSIAGLAGGLGARLVQAQQGEFIAYRQMEHIDVVRDGANPNQFPTPHVKKDWRLIVVYPELSVSGTTGFNPTANGTFYSLWFQDSQGNVFKMLSHYKDNKLGVSPNVFQMQAK
jgi:hypothetical protein